MGAESDSITISGFSGGCTAAANMHTIFSDTIKGAGLIAGGPYGDLGPTKPEHTNPPEGYA